MMLKLFCLFISIAFAEPPLKETTGVSIADAKKYAVEHNYEVLGLRKSLEEMRAKTRRTRSPYYPKLGIAGGFDSRVDAKSNEVIGLGYAYADWNVYNGFRDMYQVEKTDLEVEKADIKLQRAEFRVGLQVEKIFHLYLFKKGAIDLKQEALKLNDDHKKLAKQKRNAGLSADSDVMEFELRDSILRSDVVLFKQELEEARANLRRLLGEEIGAKIEPVGKLQHQHVKGSLMDYIKKIKDNSESIQIATKDLASTSVDSKIAVGGMLPTLDIQAKGGYLPFDFRPPQGGGNVAVMGVLKIDLFSGFDTFWERHEAEARKLKAEAQLKDAILTSVTQMEISYRKLRTIQERVDLEEENQSRADKYYHAIVSEYKRGLKNSIDLKQAAEVFYEARLRQANYKFEFLSSRIDLETALGTPIDTEAMEEKEPHAH